jgi:DNA-binding LytR/AlgR family response regulator
MLKILIVEDELITATDLKETLEKYNFKAVGIASSYREAINFLDYQLPDIVLIDVQLKNSSPDGIEIAKYIQQQFNIPFVFLTANSESETFSKAKMLNPAAYLLKPYRHKELAFQIELAYQHFQLNKSDKNDPFKAEDLFLPYNKGHQRINKSEVVLLKACGAYVNVYLYNIDAPLMFSMNLGYISQFFNQPNFIQVSRSNMINLNYLERFDVDYIYLKGLNDRIPLSQNRKQDFLKQVAIIKTP